jgi:phosphopantothenoylcysteine decarboxylase/phosphopantothenate--cysteine ligase
MNVHMWRREVTQEGVGALRERGAVIVEPEAGKLACGEVGEGRLAGVESIAEAVLVEAQRANDLTGVRVLVTAGPTQEPIDPVRFIGNRSSGKTGYAIAEEAARRGAVVTLVTGPTSLPDPFGVQCARVTTALQMRDAVDAAYGETDAVVATAAVSDFRPAVASGNKTKKRDMPSAIDLERNPDILGELGTRKEGRLLVGFAAETSDVLEEASAKLAAKNLDLVVANDVSDARLGFASDANRVWLVTPSAAEELPVMSKRAIARELWDRIAEDARAARRRREGGD